MRSRRPALFRKRQFEPIIIVTCVRWYFRFSLSLRDIKELLAERGLAVDHTTIWRWVQRHGPEIHRGLRGHLKAKSPTWHMDETFGSYPKSAIELEGFSIQQVGGKTAGVNPQSI